jgi:hypothetical protein
MFAREALYVVVALLSMAFLIRRRRRASNLPLPPGPRGWPLIDNLFDWPFESAWIPFAEWSKVFGTCFFVHTWTARVYWHRACAPIIIRWRRDVCRDVMHVPRCLVARSLTEHTKNR